MEIIKSKNHDEWKKNLKSDKGTQSWYEENKEHLDFAEKEKARFLKDLHAGKTLIIAHNAFSPEPDEYSGGYIDDGYPEFPETGGTFVKYYGCPFKSKGISPKNVVYGLQLSKHLFSQFPRSILKHSKFLTLALGTTWFFNRKAFLNILCDLMHAIDHKVVNNLTWSSRLSEKWPVIKMVKDGEVTRDLTQIFSKEILEILIRAEERNEHWPDKWYNEMEKEVERCLLLASKGEGLWEKFFKMFSPWLKLFLYIDPTYKSRVQDSLYEAKDLLDCLKTLLEREVKTYGSTGKTWWLYKLMFRIMLLTSPALKRIEKRFFDAIDKEKVKMDLDDLYFAWTYRSYNFLGLDYETRRKKREEMNKLHKVVLL